jgi:uncharacterized protein YktB (UPF0637 family)
MPGNELSTWVELGKLFGAFAFGLTVLVWFIMHLKDLRKQDKAEWEKDKADFMQRLRDKDAIIASKDATIIGLQNDQIKSSAERSKLYAEAQLLVAKAMESQEDEFKDLVRRLDSIIAILNRMGTGVQGSLQG